MSINRRHLGTTLLAAGLLSAGLLSSGPAFAQSSDEAVVTKSVEGFRVAMVAKPDCVAVSEFHTQNDTSSSTRARSISRYQNMARSINRRE